jgi:hypothetical protein
VIDKQYFLDGHASVSGWVSPGAMSMLLAINQKQRDVNVLGDLCEIGVHHGKYLLALAQLTSDQEKLVGFDLFEMQSQNLDNSGCGDIAITKKNIEKHLHVNRHIELVGANSLDLDEYRIKEYFPNGVRLFSIDGGHTEYHTINDISLAQSCISSGGVVIVDDFYNPDWPGVAEGVHRYFFLNACRKLAPFAYGDNKLYLTTHSHRNIYYEYFSGVDVVGLYRKVVHLWGYDLLHIKCPSPNDMPSDLFI